MEFKDINAHNYLICDHYDNITIKKYKTVVEYLLCSRDYAKVFTGISLLNYYNGFGSRSYYYLQFIHEETKAQKVQ